MKTIGYFVFISSVTSTILAAHNISDNERQEFFVSILKLHNHYRLLNGKGLLELDQDSTKAEKILTELQDEVNFNYGKLSTDFKLHDENAMELVSQWYKMGYDNNNSIQPSVTPGLLTNILCEGPTQLGLALKEKDGVVRVVVTYSPPCKEEAKNTTDVKDPQ